MLSTSRKAGKFARDDVDDDRVPASHRLAALSLSQCFVAVDECSERFPNGTCFFFASTPSRGTIIAKLRKMLLRLEERMT